MASLRLGLRYETGDGVRRNLEKALALYRQAGGAGFAALGRCFRLGIGVEKDEKAAAAWYEKDGAAGGRTGMLWLAWMYIKGAGVRKNRSKGERLCRQAVEMNRKEEGDCLRRMAVFREELKTVLLDLERETADEELRQKLKSLRLRLQKVGMGKR